MRQNRYSSHGPLQGCWRLSPTQESPFQFLVEFILYSQKILSDLVLEYKYVLEASITTSVIIMWWSIKMNEFIQPKYPGNVSKQKCFEYLLFIHNTSEWCNRNIWTSSLFWNFSYQILPLTEMDQIWKTGLTCKIKLGPRPTAGYNKISHSCDNKGCCG